VSQPLRLLARLLLAAPVVQAEIVAATLGMSMALCDTDKLVWGALMAVFPLLSVLGALAWAAVVAVAAFALAKLTASFGWPRTLGGIVVVWVAIFGFSWALSAVFGQHGCSILI
jgi:hypothetical protein